jgi:GWxTD domain-containing protein
MKRLATFLLLFFVSFSLSARELTANMTWTAFSTPDNKTYVETYISVIGNSVVYVKKDNGLFQASVDVVMTYNVNDSIKAAKRYVLNSPEIADTSNPVNFLDLQRVPIPAGFYNLQIVLTDLNRNPQKAISNSRSVMLDIDPDSVSVSSIELLESYNPSSTTNPLSKSGYDLVPYVSSFYPPNMEQIRFYGEIYNTTKIMASTDKFVVFYYIESVVENKRLTGFNGFAKFSPQPVNTFLYSFNITSLPSGNYNLVIEVRNSTNRLLALRKTTFERFNPGVMPSLEDLQAIDVSKSFVSKYTQTDTLIDMIRCLRPISSRSEVDFAETRIKSGEIKLMQQYFYNFWLSRNEPNPEGEWMLYKREVDKVNNEFGTPTMKGYETDRGRVYLQYGAPDQRVIVNNEPSSYPYEIWQYYTIRPNKFMLNSSEPGNTTQTNKKFVFADLDLVTNRYPLIHSDARGETRDDNWKLRLVKRDRPASGVDKQSTNPQYGGRSSDWYSDPH